MSSKSRRAYLIPLVVLAVAMTAAVFARIIPATFRSAVTETEPVPERVAAAGPAAERAYRYLMRTDLASEPLDALLADFLGRRFGIEELRRFGRGAISNLIAQGGYQSLYVRMAMPAADLPGSVKEMQLPLLDSVGPIAFYPLSALHCDRFPLDGGFLDALREEAQAGGYRSTHSALALLWGYEQGCIDKDSTSRLAEVHLAKISEILTQDLYPGDLYAEALAMVEFMSSEPAPAPFVEKLTSAQSEDGSIRPAAGEASGATHSTALFLWALLEHNEPARPPGGWIVSPGPPAAAPLRG